jgi:predicted pyridoxine 5'-phosphate oxidase superfamily flavin-nucleotide-binding protein
MLLVGSLDARGRPWASMLVGPPGFVRTPDARAMRVQAWPAPADPLADALRLGTPLGLLGLQPHTRRRNRMNGQVVACDGHGFTVQVTQSFGNCPKYIQAREPRWEERPAEAESLAQPLDARLNSPALDLLARSDTVFIASAAAADGGHGADVSHRGGKPGFVHVGRGAAGGAVTLTLPDFQGNAMFNTLGNIDAYPRAGLLAIDHDEGHVLQLTARAHIVWEGAALHAFQGAQRLLVLEVEEGRWRPHALPLRWSAPERSPQLEATGAWPAA